MAEVVASATPTAELRQIVAARNITAWFDEVQASPAKKGEIINRFLAERGVAPSRAVMVGDQFSDLEAAQMSGVGFVAYRSGNEERLFDDDIVVICHFDALADAIAVVAAGR